MNQPPGLRRFSPLRAARFEGYLLEDGLRLNHAPLPLFMKEIRAQDWNTFCQRLNEFERGATVDILWIDRETKTEQPVARAAEFEEMSFGKRDGCSDQITVRAGGERGVKTRHEIIEPIHILLREAHGRFNGVAVEAEQGTTILTFSPAIHSD